MLMLGILTYLVVIILKMSFGRPFYFSVIYKDLFGITGDNKNSLLII
nr:hypothetical protein [Entomoplasma sp. MP1]